MMSVICKFVNGSTELSLFTGPEPGQGWRISSWKPQSGLPTGSQPVGPIVEKMNLLCDATSHDDLAVQFQAMDAMRVAAADYISDRTVQDPVWFEVQMESESGSRRSLVRQIGLAWDDYEIAVHSGPADNRVRVRLEFEREGWWERTAGLSLDEGSSEETGAALVYDYTAGVGADVVGDMPARLSHLTFRSPLNSADLDRMWIGLRGSEKHGTLASFEEIWELELGALGTDAALAPDGTASPGGDGNTKVTVTPGTATWAKRLTIELQDVTGAEEENFGDYLWLLRHKLSAAETWEVQLRFGYAGMDDADYRRGPIKQVTATSWNYVEMGQCVVPLRDYHAHTLDIYPAGRDDEFAVQVWARRTSGSGTIDFDCLCPIPIDQGWLKVWGANIDGAAEIGWVIWGEGPEGRALVIESDDADLGGMPGFAYENFQLPVGDGRMIIVYAGAAAHDISEGIYLHPSTGQPDYFPRWLNLRGAA